MYSVNDDTLKCRVSPFGNPRVKVSLSTHRGLSQITTSFIASYRLGIHHIRLVTWFYNLEQSVPTNQQRWIVSKMIQQADSSEMAFWTHRTFKAMTITLNHHKNLMIQSIIRKRIILCNQLTVVSWLHDSFHWRELNDATIYLKKII